MGGQGYGGTLEPASPMAAQISPRVDLEFGEDARIASVNLDGRRSGGAVPIRHVADGHTRRREDERWGTSFFVACISHGCAGFGDAFPIQSTIVSV